MDLIEPFETCCRRHETMEARLGDVTLQGWAAKHVPVVAPRLMKRGRASA
jgi:hypothetical protein